MEQVAFVTFFDPYSTFRDERISLSNGFSFVRHLLPAGDDFVVEATIAQGAALAPRLGGYDRIYATVAAAMHAQLVQQMADARWMVGGPLAGWCEGTAAQIVTGTFEALLGLPPSQTFTYYWDNALSTETRPITYACNLGPGCYWHRCTFCAEPHRVPPRRTRQRSAVRTIIEQLRPLPQADSRAHLCSSSTPPDVLKEVLQARRTVDLELYLRADPAVVSVIDACPRSLAGIEFHIGLEAFCDDVLRHFNKGVTVGQVLDLCQRLLAKDASLRLTVMSGHAFLTPAMAEESLRCIEKLSCLHEQAPGRLTVVDCGPTGWPRETQARRRSSQVTVVQANEGRWRRYLALPQPHSAAWHANQRIADGFAASGIPLLGTLRP